MPWLFYLYYNEYSLSLDWSIIASASHDAPIPQLSNLATNLKWILEFIGHSLANKSSIVKSGDFLGPLWTYLKEYWDQFSLLVCTFKLLEFYVKGWKSTFSPSPTFYLRLLWPRMIYCLISLLRAMSLKPSRDNIPWNGWSRILVALELFVRSCPVALCRRLTKILWFA